ncbi:hypothetical protein XBKB1_1170005 [Xenorhabdus bovienii str. kraussei Becker Underwood]|uniref:Uncharacterized protein n=1 Tax=Xenorhabdus bovienii str. kraussei Becker Underwood TaxID=1398204 RepID=A0A077PPC2_XENBV|nr:hypothetical protein XBKB1_1170005 [Xenorhabdus bovienii str. kraussei Becker Underwood]
MFINGFSCRLKPLNIRLYTRLKNSYSLSPTLIGDFLHSFMNLFIHEYQFFSLYLSGVKGYSPQRSRSLSDLPTA